MYSFSFGSSTLDTQQLCKTKQMSVAFPHNFAVFASLQLRVTIGRIDGEVGLAESLSRSQLMTLHCLLCSTVLMLVIALARNCRYNYAKSGDASLTSTKLTSGTKQARISRKNEKY